MKFSGSRGSIRHLVTPIQKSYFENHILEIIRFPDSKQKHNGNGAPGQEKGSTSFKSWKLTLFFFRYSWPVIILIETDWHLFCLLGIRELRLISDKQLFLCESGDEITSLNNRCNKKNDCVDYSDEKHCDRCKWDQTSPKVYHCFFKIGEGEERSWSIHEDLSAAD